MNTRSNYRSLIEDFVSREELEDQVESNRQTLLLLIHSSKFQKIVRNKREEFGIPLKKGFTANTETLRKWAKNLDSDKWNESLYDILGEFRRLTPNYLEHIALYIKFNSIYYAPILNHKIGIARLGDQKRDWATITLYDIPDGREWKRIKKAIKDHFRRQDVEHKNPINDFELKLKALNRRPDLITGIIRESGEHEEFTDDMLAGLLINKKGDISKEKSTINLIRQYRSRLKKETKKRLG